MNLALWIVQCLLAALFAASGVFKGTWDRERLVASGQTGVQGLSTPTIRFIAISELLGAAGLILPRATGIAPWLTGLAAVGLGVIMILAAIVHTRLGEPGNVAKNMVILALCVFVAAGRL
jgi:uncharacterized membrane protein YphA (DoxX/SURF4 family)